MMWRNQRQRESRHLGRNIIVDHFCLHLCRAVQSSFKKRKTVLQNSSQNALHGDNGTLEDPTDLYTLYKDQELSAIAGESNYYGLSYFDIFENNIELLAMRHDFVEYSISVQQINYKAENETVASTLLLMLFIEGVEVTSISVPHIQYLYDDVLVQIVTQSTNRRVIQKKYNYSDS